MSALEINSWAKKLERLEKNSSGTVQLPTCHHNFVSSINQDNSNQMFSSAGVLVKEGKEYKVEKWAKRLWDKPSAIINQIIYGIQLNDRYMHFILDRANDERVYTKSLYQVASQIKLTGAGLEVFPVVEAIRVDTKRLSAIADNRMFMTKTWEQTCSSAWVESHQLQTNVRENVLSLKARKKELDTRIDHCEILFKKYKKTYRDFVEMNEFNQTLPGNDGQIYTAHDRCDDSRAKFQEAHEALETAIQAYYGASLKQTFLLLCKSEYDRMVTFEKLMCLVQLAEIKSNVYLAQSLLESKDAQRYADDFDLGPIPNAGRAKVGGQRVRRGKSRHLLRAVKGVMQSMFMSVPDESQITKKQLVFLRAWPSGQPKETGLLLEATDAMPNYPESTFLDRLSLQLRPFVKGLEPLPTEVPSVEGAAPQKFIFPPPSSPPTSVTVQTQKEESQAKVKSTEELGPPTPNSPEPFSPLPEGTSPPPFSPPVFTAPAVPPSAPKGPPVFTMPSIAPAPNAPTGESS